MNARLAAAVFVLGASTAFAQVHDEVTVEVVDVPVYVFSQGKPVRNLTKDDFELYVNGKRQAIDYFDTIDFTEPTPATSEGPSAAVVDPRMRRLFLLLFDLSFNRPAALARSQRAALTMIDHALPRDLFAVATFSSKGTDFVVPFTRDPVVLRRAVMRLSPSDAHDTLAIAVTNTEREQMATIAAGGSSPGRSRVSRDEEPAVEILALTEPLDRSRAQHYAEGQMLDFASLAARMNDIDGYKHVILFSSGFDPTLMYEEKPSVHSANNVDRSMDRARKTLAAAFHSTGALLHTIDLTVADAGSDASLKGPSLHRASNDVLFMFADDTGGEWIHHQNNLKTALADLSSISSSGYRLGFRPTNTRKGDNAINVKLKHRLRGTTLSFRNGFSSTHSMPSVDALRLADIVQNDIPQSGTAPELVVHGSSIDVVVPVRDLARQFGAVDDATLLLYVFDSRSAAVLYNEKRFSFPAEPENDRVIQQKLSLPPGTYTAKAILLAGRSIGFAKTSFTISGD